MSCGDDVTVGVAVGVAVGAAVGAAVGVAVGGAAVCNVGEWGRRHVHRHTQAGCLA